MLDRKDYDFTGFVFPDGVDMCRSTFEGPVWFDYATFLGMGNFAEATFRCDVYFRSTKFERTAYFRFATFESQVHFYQTHFEDADFSHATFQGGTYFREVRFHSTANFSPARFRGSARFFDGTRFAGYADFQNATFEGEARFVGGEDNWLFSDQADAGFGWTRFSEPERVAFRHVSLRRAGFLGADLRKVDFTDVQWAMRSGRYCAVWDELRPEDEGEEKDYALIAKLYRQLKHNYEEQQHDPITAGDFHFGEMEMRRRSGRGQVFLWLYRVISGYGESYLRALRSIGLVILAFAAAFAKLPVLALQVVPPSGTPHIVGGFWPSLLHSGMCFLLRADKPYQPVHMEGRYVSVAEGIIGPALIAMFVLALNRRFKR